MTDPEQELREAKAALGRIAEIIEQWQAAQFAQKLAEARRAEENEA